MRLWSKYMIKEMEIQQMGMNVNPSGSYNAPMGGQNIPAEKKKDGLPVGHIATTAVVGAGTLVYKQLEYAKRKEILPLLNDPNSEVSQYLAKSKTYLENMKLKNDLTFGEKIEKFETQKIVEGLEELPKMDLDNTLKHVGKNVAWAALFAGVTAGVYGGVKALTGNKEAPPQAPPNVPPTA